MANENKPNDYQLASTRLRSFQNWPLSVLVSPEKLAHAGFYYLGESDKVRCFSCNVTICDWVDGDNPQSEHRRWSPGCQFIINQLRGHAFMSAGCGMMAPYFYGHDECGADRCSRSHAFAKSIFDAEKLLPLGLMLNRCPVHPDFGSFESRVCSFDNWPENTKVTKEKLAEAGFFHLQRGGWLCCYHCNISLRDGQLVDDPWKEHARWSSKCYFVLMMRGLSFINQATGMGRATPLTCEVSFVYNEYSLPSLHKSTEVIFLRRNSCKFSRCFWKAVFYLCRCVISILRKKPSVQRPTLTSMKKSNPPRRRIRVCRIAKKSRKIT